MSKIGPTPVSWTLRLLIGCGSCSGLIACGSGSHAPQAAPPKPTVTVVTLHAQSVPITTLLPGRTVAFRVAEVRPQVTGIIQKRLFTEGSLVKAGEPLYQIDAAPYQASYDSATASLRAAQLLAERYRPLSQASVISKQDYDNAVATALVDKAAVETARINLGYTRVRSPITGRIGRSSVTEGALATANQASAFATVQQLDPIYVDVNQPNNVLLRLRRELAAGQLTRAGEDQVQVLLTLDDGTRYREPGKLLFAETSVDPTTGSVTLRALFPNPGNVLLPGTFVHERIEEGVREGAFLVPQQGVTHDQTGTPTSMVVGAQDKVEVRRLQTDGVLGTDWIVTGGLAAGDRVIVEGLQFVRPGAQVNATEYRPGKAAAAPGAADTTMADDSSGP